MNKYQIRVPKLTIYMPMRCFMKMNKSISFFFTLSLCTACCLNTHIAFSQDKSVINQTKIEAEIRFLASGISNAREQLKCGQGDVAFYQYTPKEFFDLYPPRNVDIVEAIDYKKDQELNEKGIWHFQKPNLFLEVQSQSENPDLPGKHLLSTNVTEAKLYFEEIGKRPNTQVHYISSRNGQIRPPESVLFEGIWELYSYLDPRSYISYMGYPRLLSLDRVLLEQKAPIFYEGEELYDGSRCMKVGIQSEPLIRQTFWFDIEHSFLLRRNEVNVTENGKSKLVNEWQMPQIVESNGVWLPALVEAKTYLYGTEKITADGKPKFTIRRFTMSNFKATCDIPAEDLTFNWPLGMSIDDDLHQRELVSVAVEKGDAEIWDKQRKAQEKPVLETITADVDQIELYNTMLQKQGRKKLANPIAVLVRREDLPQLREFIKKQELQRQKSADGNETAAPK